MSAAALVEIAEIRRGLDDAFEVLMDAAEAGLAALARETPATDEARGALEAVTAACAFHDLAGQRLARLAQLLSGAPERRADARLLAGPAPVGGGLSEAELETLLAG